MKRILRNCLYFVLGIAIAAPIAAYAIGSISRNQLMGLGMPDRLAEYISTSLIRVDSSGNLVLPVASGKKLSVTVNGTEKSTITSAGVLTSTGLVNTGTLSSTGVITATAGVQQSASVFETVAAGTSAQGDGPLAAGKFIHLVTGFDETKVATLPACATANIGEVHFILNNTTNKFAKVFPASGGTINSLSANSAYTQGVTGQGGKTMVCACQAANQWYCG